MTPDIGCTNCGNAGNFFNSASSNTWQVVNSTYGQVSQQLTVNGTTGNDTVCLGVGFCVPNTTMLLVSNYNLTNTSFFENEFQM
jgi:hypothetical protein